MRWTALRNKCSFYRRHLGGPRPQFPRVPPQPKLRKILWNPLFPPHTPLTYNLHLLLLTFNLPHPLLTSNLHCLTRLTPPLRNWPSPRGNHLRTILMLRWLPISWVSPLGSPLLPLNPLLQVTVMPIFRSSRAHSRGLLQGSSTLCSWVCRAKGPHSPKSTRVDGAPLLKTGSNICS